MLYQFELSYSSAQKCLPTGNVLTLVMTLTLFYCRQITQINMFPKLTHFIMKPCCKGKNAPTGHVARTGEKWNAYRILVGKPEGKRPLGRLRSRWVANINIDLRKMGWCGLD
jgi:hypothetical protein